ncbi:MAG: hypothetical protein ACJ77U_06500 [Chloroflexota bacterium]
MSNLARPLALASIIVLAVACTAAGPPATTPASVAPASASPAASPSASPGAFGAIEHSTRASDVVLRYDQGGGFVMPGFLASQAPIFTLYGDGTVIFRNPANQGPAPVGNVFRQGLFRTAHLSEEQIQATLEMAIGQGQLGIAKREYESAQVADASTALFTVNAGGLKKTVSVYALGIDTPNMADALPRAAFQKLAERLGDFDQGGSIETGAYVPSKYRGILMDGGPGDPAAKPWPWKDLAPADFTIPADPNAIQFPVHVLTAEQVAALGVEDPEGGFQGATLVGPKGTFYSLSVRPLLPDDLS